MALPLALAALIVVSVWASPDASADEQTPRRATVGFLTAQGRVLMPDGTPAAGATVRAMPDDDGRPILARADQAGLFRLRGIFGNGCRLHASSADGRQQMTLKVSSAAARKELAVPLELKLRPALSHEVTVVAGSRPVEGAQVMAGGGYFRSTGVTGRDGRVLLHVPAGESLEELAAWHPQLGVDGRFDYMHGGLRGKATTLSLHAPAPHTVRVVDTEGNPVAGLELSFAIRLGDSAWIPVREFEDAHAKTGADGTAVVSWMPGKRPAAVDARPVGSDWKVDHVDNTSNHKGVTTLEVRRKQAIVGRIVMPEGANAEGLFVTGFGFGPKHHGDIPYARSRRDGWFTLHVPAEHAYTLGIADLEWASDTWSGLIVATGEAQTARISLEAYPATPVTIRVTRGPEHQPVPDVWIESSSAGSVDWIDGGGNKQTAVGRVNVWLKTGANGEVKTGAGRGKQSFRLSTETWPETEKIEIASADPIEIEFHRAWVGDRHVTGHLTAEGAPYEPALPVAGKGWLLQSNYQLLTSQPTVHADGTFDVAFDADELWLLVVDAKKRRSGYIHIASGELAVEVPMQEMASFSGTLVDANEQPLANHVVRLRPLARRGGPEPAAASVDYDAAGAQTTDAAGRFLFPSVPPGVPLQVVLDQTADGPREFIPGSDIKFEPGEKREGNSIVVRRSDAASAR